MKKRQFSPVSALAVITLSLITWPAAASEIRAIPASATQPVNVNLSFSTQVPLADRNVQTVAAAQKSNRTFLYRLATEECTTLKEVIAKTCRLTSLNISTQIQNRHNQNPLMLHINVNAQFTISLKDERGG